jgi:protein-L-isoaspartate(D-aspartate) O-methyltransferase
MIYERQKQKMLQRLEGLGIYSQSVLRAMDSIPRHQFIGSGLELQAYDEKALPIGYEQTISHPYTVAIMSQSLMVKKEDKILEIGTGSGYQAAILAQMGARVFTVERIKPLADNAKKIFKSLKLSVLSKTGDGTLGWAQHAPYQSIIVTAGAPVVPEQLISQLMIGGRLIIPVGNKAKQVLTIYEKTKDSIIQEEITKLNFVPLIGKDGWSEDENKMVR